MRSEEVGNGGGSGGTEDDVRGSGRDASLVCLNDISGGFIKILGAGFSTRLLFGGGEAGFVLVLGLEVGFSGGLGASL